MDANAASVTARVPRRDLLDQPRIAIGILEGEERAVARALGIRAAQPRLHGERRAMPHPTRVDATADEFGMGRCDVGDDQRTHGRARRGRSYSLAERDRARGARGRELDDADVLRRGVIGVEPPTQPSVELLGSLDVGHGDDVDLELHVDLFCDGACLTHVILRSLMELEASSNSRAGLTGAAWCRAPRCVQSTAPVPAGWARSPPALARSDR